MSGDEPAGGTPPPRWLTIGLFVALAACLAPVIWYWLRAAAYPFPLDYGEGPLLDQAVRLGHGAAIYRIPGADPPWTISNYPPLYPLVQSLGVVLVGPAYWYGRLISILAALGAGGFAGLTVKAATGDRLGAGVTAALVPVMPYVGYWAGLARIDLLALTLSLAGLWCVVRRPRSLGWLAGGVLLLAAAGFTRQTYLLAAPLTAFVWLLYVGWRSALAFAGCLAGVVGLCGLALNAASDGGFWFNVVTSNVNPWDVATLRPYLSDFLVRVPILVGLGVAYVVVAIGRRPRSARVVLPYLGAAAIVAATAGKVGSNVNYLLEVSVAVCLAAGCLVAAMRASARWLPVVLVAVLLQALGLVLLPYGNYGRAASLAQDDSAERLSEIIAATPGSVLADEAMGLLPLVRKPIELQPFELTQLANAGIWDQSPVLTALYEQRYAAVLIFRVPGYPLAEQRWTPEMLAAIQSAYEVVEEVPGVGGTTEVYRPVTR